MRDLWPAQWWPKLSSSPSFKNQLGLKKQQHNHRSCATGIYIAKAARQTTMSTALDFGAALAATNIFERQPDGAWRVVLHQAHAVVGLR